MNGLRNPFRLQAAEHIDSDTTFLRLFGPGVLRLLPERAANSRHQFIRSAPGGGKTSLLKLMTPHVLQSLDDQKAANEFRELHQVLRKLDVIDDQEIRIIGIMLPCGRTFSDLADLGLNRSFARRLLLALLDARLMLATLRASLIATGLKYPDDLDRVNLDPKVDFGEIPDLDFPATGETARDWAQSLERSICEVIDSFSTPNGHGPRGHDALLILPLLDSRALRIDGQQVNKHWLVLLDDVHKMTLDQQRDLRTTILEQRSEATIWISERLEALSKNELLSSGALDGRDYGNIVELENVWRDHPSHFEAAMRTIADRRVRISSDAVTGNLTDSFQYFLDGSGTPPEFQYATSEAVEIVTERIYRITSGSQKYSQWVSAKQRLTEALDDPYKRLMEWRTLEILIERDRRKSQLSFDFELDQEELEDKDNSRVRSAAELFLAKEFGLPYFYGSSRLARLGSYNIEQYLQLAGDLFEEVLARTVRRQPPFLSPRRQHEIIVRASRERIENIPIRVKEGRDILSFLRAVAEFCRDVTFQPNAPYAPGVNGVAISMDERRQLLDESQLERDPALDRFAQMLTAAISNNLLHADVGRRVKGQTWMILYLNRIVCPDYFLPLNLGGFREQRVSTLVRWMESGYETPKATASLR